MENEFGGTWFAHPHMTTLESLACEFTLLCIDHRRYWLYISYERCFLLGCGLVPVETLALENPVIDHPALGGVLLSTSPGSGWPVSLITSFVHKISTFCLDSVYAMDFKSLLDTTLWIYLIVWDSLLLLRQCGLPEASRFLLPWCFTRRWITQIFEKAITPWSLDAWCSLMNFFPVFLFIFIVSLVDWSRTPH